MAGIPFDLRGAELSHRQGRCTLAAIAAGVLAIFDGIRDGSSTDEEHLERAFVVCDAIYAYCSRASEAAFDL